MVSQEYAELNKNPPQDMKVDLVSENDIYKWRITINGPKDSPYATLIQKLHQQGGRFLVYMTLPVDFPFKPPVISWQTKIYHPNVSNDDKGLMCLGILRDGEWKPSSKLNGALEYIRQLLVEPNADDAIEQAIGRQYKEDRKEFIKMAKKWTKDYA
ncbi:MAG: hypothetical protein Q9201_005748 [Fulgogasparrea decipioides]